MPPKTIKQGLANMLEDLTPDDYKKFCSQLVGRKEEPRVRRNRVEGRDFLDVADVLVATFTEQGSVDVAVEILKDIECNNDADELVKSLGGLYTKPASSGGASSSDGTTNVTTNADDKHFVDKYRVELINRVSNIDPILDGLLDRGVIQQEIYDKIRGLPTTQEKVRGLYSGPLKAAKACKDAFLKLLEENEKYLISELKQ